MKIGAGRLSRVNVPILGWQALKWNCLGNVMRSLSQFVIGILLARLLGPEPFGIVAVAWIILGIGNLFADMGFGAALVQRESLTALDLRFIFTCQMAFASLLTALGVLSSEFIAAYFHKPDAKIVIQVLFTLFVLQSLGQTGAAVLRRSLNFKVLQEITIISYLVGYLLIGIPAAIAGLGVWSLVAAQLVQSSLSSFLLIRTTAVPIAPYLHRGSPDIVKFGLKVTAANLSSWCISFLDTVFIGRAFGVLDLGLYNRAINLLSAPMNIIISGFQGVLFSVCARTQNDKEKIKRIYLETTSAVAIICFPIFITAAVIPETIVIGIYGPKWQASVPIIMPLSLAVLVHALLAIKGPILTASNNVIYELKNQIYTILVFIPMLFIAVRYSMVAVAWVVFFAYMTRWILLAVDTLHFTGATIGEYARTFRIPIIFGAAVSTASVVTDSYLHFLPAFTRLIAVGVVATFTLLVFTKIFGGKFLGSNLGTLVDVKNLSGAARRFLNV
jgi:O-antigen/teichoic acid export membrane protein